MFFPFSLAAAAARETSFALSVFLPVCVGLLCGLIPLSVARSRDNVGAGVACLAACGVAGFFGGLLFALPLAGLLALVLHLALRRS